MNYKKQSQVKKMKVWAQDNNIFRMKKKHSEHKYSIFLKVGTKKQSAVKNLRADI